MKADSASHDPLAAIYREHHAFVWRSLRCLGVVDSAIDDAVQDVFVVVHRRLHQFEERSSLRTWLYQIARRIAWKYRQRASRDAARSFELPELADGPNLDEAVARAQALEILRAFVDGLDQDKAAVFVLTEFGGLEGHEIARSLDVNVNTVHARLRAARTQLGRMVQRLQARDTRQSMPAADRLAPALTRARPSAEQRRRTWALLVVKLGMGRVAAPWFAAGSSKALAAALAVPLTAALVWGAWPSPSSSHPTPASDVAAAHPTPTPESVREESAPAIDPVAVGRPTSATPPAVAVPVGRAPPRARPTPQAAPPDPLEQELALVGSIRGALAHHSPKRALEFIAQHHLDHSNGALVSEVAALTIEALCATGREAQATTAAARFTARWPNSSLDPGPDPCANTSPRGSIASR